MGGAYHAPYSPMLYEMHGDFLCDGALDGSGLLEQVKGSERTPTQLDLRRACRLKSAHTAFYCVSLCTWGARRPGHDLLAISVRRRPRSFDASHPYLSVA